MNTKMINRLAPAFSGSMLALCLAACGTTENKSTPPTAVNLPSAAAPMVSNTATNNADAVPAYDFDNSNYAQRAEVIAFVDMMNAKYDYPKARLLQAFGQAERMDTVLRQLDKDKPNPNFKKNWNTYRARYIEPIRIKAGVAFWQKHAKTLSRATQVYGVPEYIIAGIIGVETIYGQVMGEHVVFDVLTTLAFDYPRRSQEYKNFLEHFIILSQENAMPLRSVKGSYAGAIGIPQFMPDSWRDYGVDFDGDGKIDLRNSPADAIGSVARFLREKGGWQPGLDVAYNVQFGGEQNIEGALKLPVQPSSSMTVLNNYGVYSSENIPNHVKLSLIDLPNGDAPTKYVLGSQNFYAITRYNKSYMYAMSVYELGAAVKAGYDAQKK